MRHRLIRRLYAVLLPLLLLYALLLLLLSRFCMDNKPLAFDCMNDSGQRKEWSKNERRKQQRR